MAESQRGSLIDQWRPEDSKSSNDRLRERSRLERSRSRSKRGRSPASPRRLQRDHIEHSKHNSRAFSRNSRNRSLSRRRSRSRRRYRERAPTPVQEDRDDLYRPSRNRLPSAERSHRYRHRSPSPAKHRRSISRSRSRDSTRRTKRRRSRSVVRSPSRSRRSDVARRTDRAFSPRESRLPRRISPDSYIPPSRRRSRSVESSRYRPSSRTRRRSPTPNRRASTKRATSPRRTSSTKHRDRRSASVESRKEKPKDLFETRLRSDKDLGDRIGKEQPRSSLTQSKRTRSPSPRKRPSSPATTRSKQRSRSRSGAVLQRRRSRTPPRRNGRSPRSSRPASRKRAAKFAPDSPRTQYSKEDYSMRGSFTHGRPSRPQVDTRNYSNSPPYNAASQMTPSGHSSYGGRGGHGGNNQYGSHQGSPAPGYSPQQSPYAHQSPNQAQYYQNQQINAQGGNMSPGYNSPSYRGGHTPTRGNHRFPSGPSTSGYGAAPSRGRGAHFSNLSWTPATGNRGGKAPIDKTRAIMAPIAAQSMANAAAAQGAKEEETDNPFRPSADMRAEGAHEETDNPFRPSKELRVEDTSASTDGKKSMPPPSQPTAGSTSPAGPKISFALKTKPATQPAIAPKADLGQKAREALSTSKAKASSPSTSRRESDPYDRRYDSYDDRRRNDYRKDDRRDDRRDRRDDRWDDRDRTRDRYEDARGSRRDDRRDERRDERRDDWSESSRYADSRRRALDSRIESRSDTRPERRLEKASEPPCVRKKTIKREKPRPKLSPDFAASDSVYYRKPGNESVIGSGTYGKVFKGVHVYTKDMVALKKIRMEGERDGFPVTAIREIKLLQSLNHDNVVKLREVMVEKNDCFMVFEYLSHDLTGLLNHPTFSLDHGQKKDLAKQLFDGLNYLHTRGVLHRDIKAANILVSSTGVLKLADFGLARFYAKRGKLDYTNRVITIWYRSPELLLGETQYGPAVDIWSAACVLVEIFTKHAIFPGDGGEINQLDKIYNVLGTPTRSEWPAIVDMQWFELLRPMERKYSTFAEKYQDRVTPAAFELLCDMFQYNPAKRPSASDVLEHRYFASEEPKPRRAVELAELKGDWHEFESKALRKEKERADREARHKQREIDAGATVAGRIEPSEKRRAEAPTSERDAKRVKADGAS